MEQALMVTTVIMLTILTFIVGGVIGWILSNFYIQPTPAYVHPEFMDENGNILPDEILAVRFENDYIDYNEEEDDD